MSTGFGGSRFATGDAGDGGGAGTTAGLGAIEVVDPGAVAGGGDGAGVDATATIAGDGAAELTEVATEAAETGGGSPMGGAAVGAGSIIATDTGGAGVVEGGGPCVFASFIAANAITGAATAAMGIHVGRRAGGTTRGGSLFLRGGLVVGRRRSSASLSDSSFGSSGTSFGCADFAEAGGGSDFAKAGGTLGVVCAGSSRGAMGVVTAGGGSEGRSSWSCTIATSSSFSSGVPSSMSSTSSSDTFSGIGVWRGGSGADRWRNDAIGRPDDFRVGDGVGMGIASFGTAEERGG